MATAVGDILTFPVVVWSPHEERDTGYFGAVQVLAKMQDEWLVGALEHLEQSPDVDRDAPLLSPWSDVGIARRDGPLLSSGSEWPTDWQHRGQGDFDDRKRALSDAFGVWKSKTSSMYDSQTAYAALGSVSDGLGSIADRVAMEWRVRFELATLLEERAERERRAAEARQRREANRTWEVVSKQKVGRGFPRGFAKKLRGAWTALIARCEPQPSPAELEQALVCFFEALADEKHAGEYRDEITRLATDVATRRGGTEDLAVRLAERALS